MHYFQAFRRVQPTEKIDRRVFRNRLKLFFYGCAIHGMKDRGKEAKRLAALGKGKWACCSLCHAICVLDAFEKKYPALKEAALKASHPDLDTDGAPNGYCGKMD